MPRMGKTEEDWNGLKLGFLKTVQPNSFSKLIPAACNFKNNAQETYLFVSDLWFCHLPVISLLTLSSIAIEGEWLAKLNKMNWTTVTQPLQVKLLSTFCNKFSQPVTTLFVVRLVWTWLVKRATSLLNLFRCNVAKQVARFCCPLFYCTLSI